MFVTEQLKCFANLFFVFINISLHTLSPSILEIKYQTSKILSFGQAQDEVSKFASSHTCWFFQSSQAQNETVRIFKLKLFYLFARLHSTDILKVCKLDIKLNSLAHTSTDFFKSLQTQNKAARICKLTHLLIFCFLKSF